MNRHSAQKPIKKEVDLGLEYFGWNLPASDHQVKKTDPDLSTLSWFKTDYVRPLELFWLQMLKMKNMTALNTTLLLKSLTRSVQLSFAILRSQFVCLPLCGQDDTH